MGMIQASGKLSIALERGSLLALMNPNILKEHKVFQSGIMNNIESEVEGKKPPKEGIRQLLTNVWDDVKVPRKIWQRKMKR